MYTLLGMERELPIALLVLALLPGACSGRSRHESTQSILIEESEETQPVSNPAEAKKAAPWHPQQVVVKQEVLPPTHSEMIQAKLDSVVFPIAKNDLLDDLGFTEEEQSLYYNECDEWHQYLLDDGCFFRIRVQPITDGKWKSTDADIDCVINPGKALRR